jgi:succinate dehydrogenase/fumarate reductase cytochrome b subunit
MPTEFHDPRMSGLVSRARVGERFEDIAAHAGRSVSEVRHAVLAWAEREAAAMPEQKVSRREASGAWAAGPPRSCDGVADRAGAWLRLAGVAVGLVAVAAAAVSYEAQWRLVYRDKHEVGVSYVQAAIPDLGSLVFACFGIALALHGRRAVRARLLNLLCVGISITMNALAARSGWTGLAVWVMSPVIYALASDTLIGVVRAYVIARQKRLREALADDGVTPLQLVGAVLLWLLRLVWAPPSTLRGFHRWVKSLPTAPPIREQGAGGGPPEAVRAAQRERRAIANSRARRGGTKQEQFLTLVMARYGPLTEFDVRAVSRAAAELAPEAELHPGTARKILRAQVLAAQNGDPR